MQRTTRIIRQRPQGFSLIELLVVISIIVTLLAISLGVLGNTLTAGRITATKTTIAKVEALLQDQLTAWNREFGSDNTAEGMKTLAQTQFPQTGPEAGGPDLDPCTTGDNPSAYAAWIIANWDCPANTLLNPSVNTITVSSELLYLTLTNGKVFGATPADTDSFSGSELADTDGDGFAEIVDNWGNPLQFYRWPTRLLNPFGFVIGTTTAAVNDSVVSIPYVSSTTPDFSDVMTDIQNTSIGGDTNATMFVVIGSELIEVGAAGGGNFSVQQRGALGTVAESHRDGATVKLAPFPEIVNLLFGSLTTSAVTRDPDDARGIVLNAHNGSAVDITTFEDDRHTLDSYYTPLIISAGPDETLGILSPTLAGTGPYDRGNLAMPDTRDSSGTYGNDLSVIVNPGSTALSDNITNVGGGN